MEKRGKLNAKWIYGLAVVGENGEESTYTWTQKKVFIL